MEIKGKVHCFFEQSGTFKNEFIKLGIPAEDYDIQDNFGETDHVEDLFKAIEAAYDGKPSLFDGIVGGEEDLIMAFFPCIYFCEKSMSAFRYNHNNYRSYDDNRKLEEILKRNELRHKFYTLLLKLVGVCQKKNIRMIIENPFTKPHYLDNNFIFPPTIVDKNRMLRGDYFVKPTAFWFVNCTNTFGFTEQRDKKQKIVANCERHDAGICGEERSMISPDYARNFICDFVIGKEQQGTQLSLF